MKRRLGLMASNWLRNPDNQEKLKRTARQLWHRFQDRNGSGAMQTNAGSPASRDGSSDQVAEGSQSAK